MTDHEYVEFNPYSSVNAALQIPDDKVEVFGNLDINFIYFLS